jgi:hypothetical protein
VQIDEIAPMLVAFFFKGLPIGSAVPEEQPHNPTKKMTIPGDAKDNQK